MFTDLLLAHLLPRPERRLLPRIIWALSAHLTDERSGSGIGLTEALDQARRGDLAEGSGEEAVRRAFAAGRSRT